MVSYGHLLLIFNISEVHNFSTGFKKSNDKSEFCSHLTLILMLFLCYDSDVDSISVCCHELPLVSLNKTAPQTMKMSDCLQKYPNKFNVA